MNDTNPAVNLDPAAQAAEPMSITTTQLREIHRALDRFKAARHSLFVTRMDDEAMAELGWPPIPRPYAYNPVAEGVRLALYGADA